ncbi:MAG: pilus assembly protein [Elusimicrobiota bacterium]|nr:pilus assembly protein [Elusimicrobiota bacterium]
MSNKGFFQTINAVSKGQALVEAALTIPTITLFLFAIFYFAHFCLTYQQLIGAARYGTDLIANTSLNEKEIEKDIRNYLCHKSTLGRTLNPDNLKIKVDLKEFKKMSLEFSAAEKIAGALNQFAVFAGKAIIFNSRLPGIINIDKAASSVEVIYYFKYPSVLKIAGRDSFELKVKNEILAGTGIRER